MAVPRLIKPTTIVIARQRRTQEPMDEVFREPRISDDERALKEPTVQLKAQVVFWTFEAQQAMFTGTDERTDGYAVIKAADQEHYQFKPNDRIVGIKAKRKAFDTVSLRILQAWPRAHRQTFGLYYLVFQRDGKA